MGNGSFYGWKLVGALWFLYLLNMGFPLYGGVVINTYMMKEIAMDRSTFGMGFTLLNFFVGVPSILVAMAIMKWGIRATFGIGGGLLLIGTLWMAFFANQPWHYLVGFGMIIGGGIGCSTIVPLSTAVTRWFKKYRGRAMALTMTASGFAGLIGAPLMNQLLAMNGGNWRQAWLVVGGIVIAAALIAFLFVKERPEDLGQVPDGEEEAISDSAGANPLATKDTWTPSEAYRTPAFWLVAVGSFACQYPFFFFTAHWILHLRGVGITPADAAMAMGLFTMGGIFGRLIGGTLIDKIPARFVFMMGICCYFVGSFLALGVTANSLMAAFAAAILYGAGFGWTFVCLNTMVGNYWGAASFPKINGTLLLISAIVCSPAGMVGGKIFDAFKSYQFAFYLNVAICVVGIIALVFATMPRKEVAQKEAVMR